MAVPQTTAHSFLELLDRSGLASHDQVQAILAEERLDDSAAPLDVARSLVQHGLLTRYQAERLLEGRSRGFFIDNFRILELLGAGGMSFLYLAQDQATGRQAALKVVTEKHRADPGMLTRLKLEARAGQRLSHPNIVRTFGIRAYEDVFGEIPYLVMEFVEGVNLEELLQMRGRVDWPQACDFGRQAADGLRAAHRAGIIHRDVKPGNLLVDRQGHIRLLDFGLALLESKEDADEFSLAMIFGHDCLGTADFIAPEQTRDSFSVDARADVYSLGCTLYTVFSGVLPFPEESSRQKIEGHRNRNPTPIEQLVPGLPSAVARLMARMMAKDPRDRPKTMDEVVAVLGKYGRKQPIAFDFPRMLAYRASQARRRLADASRSSTTRVAGGSSARQLSHWTTSSTRKLPHVGSETSIDREQADTLKPAPVALFPDPSIGTIGAGATADSEPALTPQNGGPPIRLTGDRVVIGRYPTCDVVIAHPAISGRHCELRRTDEGWLICDLGSKNGVLVNQRLLFGQENSRLLQPGDELSIGRALRYRFPGATHKETRLVNRWIAIAAAVVLLAAAAAAFALWIFNRGERQPVEPTVGRTGPATCSAT